MNIIFITKKKIITSGACVIYVTVFLLVLFFWGGRNPSSFREETSLRVIASLTPQSVLHHMKDVDQVKELFIAFIQSRHLQGMDEFLWRYVVQKPWKINFLSVTIFHSLIFYHLNDAISEKCECRSNSFFNTFKNCSEYHVFLKAPLCFGMFFSLSYMAL